MKVNSSWTYNVSFFYRFPTSSAYSGKAIVALTGESGSVYASNTTELHGSQTEWTQINLTLTPTSSPSSTNNSFTISLPDAAGETIHFAMFSLFPPTYKNRINGMRIDLAEILIATQPKFWRFPGGNNLVRLFVRNISFLLWTHLYCQNRRSEI
jgi:alpha-L-arabinofuranosidase